MGLLTAWMVAEVVAVVGVAVAVRSHTRQEPSAASVAAAAWFWVVFVAALAILANLMLQIGMKAVGPNHIERVFSVHFLPHRLQMLMRPWPNRAAWTWSSAVFFFAIVGYDAWAGSFRAESWKGIGWLFAGAGFIFSFGVAAVGLVWAAVLFWGVRLALTACVFGALVGAEALAQYLTARRHKRQEALDVDVAIGRSRKLNGWQRLWLVASGGWLLIVVWMAIAFSSDTTSGTTGRWLFVLLAGGFWLVSVVLVYCLGWIIGWVARGGFGVRRE